MPGNKAHDLITDQEIAFARLVLSGTMSDQDAAKKVGFKPSVAAYIKAKPRVAAFMQQHRADTQKQLIEYEADGLRRQRVLRERVLDRLWEIANLSPTATRDSISGQVKAMAMIVAIESLIPAKAGPGAAAAGKPPAPQPTMTFYKAAWRRDAEQETENEGHAPASDPHPGNDGHTHHSAFGPASATNDSKP